MVFHAPCSWQARHVSCAEVGFVASIRVPFSHLRVSPLIVYPVCTLLLTGVPEEALIYGFDIPSSVEGHHGARGGVGRVKRQRPMSASSPLTVTKHGFSSLSPSDAVVPDATVLFNYR